jgi:hypothetical protein
LFGWAFKGLEQIYRPGYRYIKAGVMLNRPAPTDGLSMRLPNLCLVTISKLR